MLKEKWYERTATVAKFLLGGMTAGNISLGSRGQLCDWEIMNHPAVGFEPPYTFFALRAKDASGRINARLLESEFCPPYEASHGIYSWSLGGMPRFRDSKLCGRCSRAIVRLADPSLALEVELEGFTPFIPLDYKNSSIPALVMHYRIKNTAPDVQEISVCGSMGNLVGYVEKELFGSNIVKGTPINTPFEDEALQGIYCTSDLPKEDFLNGSMVLAAMAQPGETSVRASWLNGNWWDGAHDFWNDFCEDGRINAEGMDIGNDSKLTSNNGKLQVGSVCVTRTLAPGEETIFSFIIAWHFPNRPSKWNGHVFKPESEINETIAHNYYVNYFPNALECTRYLAGNFAELYEKSLMFENALYSSSLPDAMLDAVIANITVLRSTTCFRFSNGKFFGWEGTFNHRGSCEGNCTHVWNYAQTLAFLFPEVEQDMRRTEFLLETDEKGEMAFRTAVAMGNRRFDLYPPAADGQMGCIVRLYRDWKISGDLTLIREMWDAVKRCLKYAMTEWDTDGDFVFDSMQHNTYDVEFYGLTSMTNGIFYAALLAAAEMAEAMAEPELAAFYRECQKKGSENLDRMLFNGEYYVQQLADFEKYKYQYGDGCLSDQLFGQQLAHILGLGWILPEEHVKQAICAVYDHNYLENLQEHVNVQRAYALGDEGGLLMCTWPRGNRPRFPFPYSDEVWTGVEYHVAVELIYSGYPEKAAKIVETLRSRYDGVKRNPWNEVECGNHYVRSMASWGLLIAMSGCLVDLTRNTISFHPVVKGNFQCFFSTGKSWGIYRQINTEQGLKRNIEILYGDKSLQLAD